jgi:hypothetical protein
MAAALHMSAIGFRAKTGRAIVVAITDDLDLLFRREVSLVDPALPDTAQPYHAVMTLPWPEAQVAVQPLVAAIEEVATRVVAALLKELGDVRAIGVVGSPPKDLARIGNQHIRAHGAEGVLFRRVLEVAAERNGIACRGFAEKELGPPNAAIKALGKKAGPPWRADERAAATAAWLALRKAR